MTRGLLVAPHRAGRCLRVGRSPILHGLLTIDSRLSGGQMLAIDGRLARPEADGAYRPITLLGLPIRLWLERPCRIISIMARPISTYPIAALCAISAARRLFGA